MDEAWLRIVVPAAIAGMFSIVTTLVTLKLSARAERRRLSHELKMRMDAWQREFASRYAELMSNNPKQDGALRQQFSGAYLYVKSKDGSNRCFIPEGIKMTIGNDETCDIVLDDILLSRQHAIIEIVDGKAYVSDLGSTNGSYLDDKPIGRRAFLRDGAKLQFGEVEAVFRII